ncbi:MAG: hypothetical protein QJR06_08040 [Alicyclobacillaceae bacterium]|nr:hypothetical protein [Alicyclobacillaceae bacterium]
MGTLTDSQREAIHRLLVRLFRDRPATDREKGVSGRVEPGRTTAESGGNPGKNQAVSASPSMIQRALELWKIVEEDMASRLSSQDAERGMNYVVRATLAGPQRVPPLRDHPEGQRLQRRVEHIRGILFRIGKKEQWEAVSRLVERRWRPQEITYAEAVYFLSWLRRLIPKDRGE